MRLYLFDFDGTLTKKDTLFDFLKSTQSNYYVGYILFIPLFILAKLKVLDSGKVKEKFIAFFLKDKTTQEINQFARVYFEKSDDLFHESAKEYLLTIKDYPNKYFVSASLEIWLKPFAEFYNFKLICTKAKFKNNLYTGKYDGVNCNHEQKVLRINQEINLKDFSEIFVFGDTQGDKGMLNLATKSHFQFFRKGL